MEVTSFRPVDRQVVLRFISHQSHVHYHLDWEAVPVWLHDTANLTALAWQAGRLRGVMTFTPPHNGACWLRLLGITAENRTAIFLALWNFLLPLLIENDVQIVAGMSNHAWVVPLLEKAGFTQQDSVVNFTRSAFQAVPLARPATIKLRDIQTEAEINQAIHIDHTAFAPLWQMRGADQRAAAQRAVSYKLAQEGKQAVAYQMTMRYDNSIHLARLATLPDYQGKGIGRILVCDLLVYARQTKAYLITVNTQASNLQSQRLYESLGFHREPDGLPIYMRAIPPKTPATPP